MNTRIRPAEPDDVPALVTLRSAVYPFLVRGVAATRHLIADPPPGEDRASFVAEESGEVVGTVTAYTGNDESNRPMPAVNTRLGYRPVATQWSCLATL